MLKGKIDFAQKRRASSVKLPVRIAVVERTLKLQILFKFDF